MIVAVTPPAARAATAATKTIPIVFTTMLEPAKAGLVESLNRPGGNVTGGGYTLATALEGKRLELLRKVVPGCWVMEIESGAESARGSKLRGIGGGGTASGDAGTAGGSAGKPAMAVRRCVRAEDD